MRTGEDESGSGAKEAEKGRGFIAAECRRHCLIFWTDMGSEIKLLYVGSWHLPSIFSISVGMSFGAEPIPPRHEGAVALYDDVDVAVTQARGSRDISGPGLRLFLLGFTSLAQIKLNKRGAHSFIFSCTPVALVQISHFLPQSLLLQWFEANGF